MKVLRAASQHWIIDDIDLRSIASWSENQFSKFISAFTLYSPYPGNDIDVGGKVGMFERAPKISGQESQDEHEWESEPEQSRAEDKIVVAVRSRGEGRGRNERVDGGIGPDQDGSYCQTDKHPNCPGFRVETSECSGYVYCTENQSNRHFVLSDIESVGSRSSGKVGVIDEEEDDCGLIDSLENVEAKTFQTKQFPFTANPV